MTKHGEAYCLAILMTNLKRRERGHDPITIADCTKTLCDLYGNSKQVSRMVGVTDSVIRKWIKLANAPEELRQKVKEGKIYPVAAFTILSRFSDDRKRIEVTREVIGWGEPEIVRFTKFVKENPQLTVSQCKNQFMTDVMAKLLAGSKDVTSDTE